MKFFTIILASVFSISVTAADLKWGVTLGTALLEYENEETTTEYDNTEEASYTTPTLGLDVSSGKHLLSYKITSGGYEQLDIVRSPATVYTANSRVASTERDHEEISLTYQYQLGGGWGLGIQFNDVKNDYKDKYSSNYDHYDWNGNFNVKNELDGWALFGTYVRQIPDSDWVFASKLGIALLDHNNTLQWKEIITTTDNYYDVLPTLNGSGFNTSQTATGDATSAVFGLTMIYIASSKSSIRFNYDTRVDDFGERDYSSVNQVGSGYFSENVFEQTPSTNEQTSLEETNWKFSIEWRYRLN